MILRTIIEVTTYLTIARCNHEQLLSSCEFGFRLMKVIFVLRIGAVCETPDFISVLVPIHRWWNTNVLLKI